MAQCIASVYVPLFTQSRYIVNTMLVVSQWPPWSAGGFPPGLLLAASGRGRSLPGHSGRRGPGGCHLLVVEL